MEKIELKDRSIRSIFTERLEKFYGLRRLEDGPEDFYSLEEIFEFLKNRHPRKVNQINNLYSKLLGQDYDEKQFYLIAVFLDAIFSRENSFTLYEMHLFALSKNENWQKEELRRRHERIQELQVLLASYQTEFEDSNTQIEEYRITSQPVINSISSKIKQVF